MRVVVQRVLSSNVTVNHEVVSSIQHGFVLLVGLKKGDTEKDLKYMASKIRKLRVFSDSEGKMNLSIEQVGGEILSISQFTLYGDVKKQNRPGFSHALPFEEAKVLYQQFNQLLKEEGLTVKTGIFGEDMAVSLVNDGPVTLIINTDE